jgi:hypothetical protein
LLLRQLDFARSEFSESVRCEPKHAEGWSWSCAILQTSAYADFAYHPAAVTLAIWLDFVNLGVREREHRMYT